MSVLKRQPYINLVFDNPNLTKRQKQEIRDNVIHPMLRSVDSAIGQAVLFACRLNQTKEGAEMLSKDRNS